MLLGRQATEAEIKAGLDYIRTEPMKEYEEKKLAKDTKGTKDTKKKKTEIDSESEEAADTMKADGMMGGVKPDAGKDEDKKKLLPVTPWGRYLKVLLSSSEFLFVS